MSLYRAGSPARVYLGDALASAVYRGDVEVWRRDPTTTTIDASVTVTVPSWAALADIGVLGGGGGGATADNGASNADGIGGSPAVWSVGTFSVTPGASVAFTVGNGGAGASGGVKRSGTSGGPSSASGGAVSVQSPGGSGGVGGAGDHDTTGRGASPRTVGDMTYPGGGDVSTSAAGSAPGGGGGGGLYPGWFGSAGPAGTGAEGRAVVRFRSY